MRPWIYRSVLSQAAAVAQDVPIFSIYVSWLSRDDSGACSLAVLSEQVGARLQFESVVPWVKVWPDPAVVRRHRPNLAHNAYVLAGVKRRNWQVESERTVWPSIVPPSRMRQRYATRRLSLRGVNTFWCWVKHLERAVQVNAPARYSRQETDRECTR